MARKILISSLGESPAVVTETVDAIEREERIQLDEVITLRTRGTKVDSADSMLYDEFANFYQGRISYWSNWIDAYDVDDEASNMTFMEIACETVRTYNKRDDDVYVSLAGGRKTMSAIMVLAAQLYGAKMLCHVLSVWEEEGHIDKLKWMREDERKEIMHPEPEDITLVRLPLVSLFPLMSDFTEALRGDAEIKTDISVMELMQTNGLIERKDGKIEATTIGKQLLNLLEQVEMLPEPVLETPEDKFTKCNIRDHGYNGQLPKVKDFIKRLLRSPYVVKVDTATYARHQRTEIAEAHDDGTLTAYYRLRTFSAGLKIYTTAQNKGQAHRVAKTLQTFFKK